MERNNKLVRSNKNKEIKAGLCLLLLIISFTANAQVFWTENFGEGCSQGNLASSYSGTNGAWSVAITGTNDTYSNTWYVSATEAGMGVDNCGDGCGNDASLINRTLHLGPSPLLGGDAGATYNAGGICGLGICVATDARAESPIINCNGYDTITISFNYFMQGCAGSDYAALAYYDGSSWLYYNGSLWTSTFSSLVSSNNASCAGQGYWTAYTAQLPASANNNSSIKIGFRWTNNDDGVGTDPSFAVDDITLSGTAALPCSISVSISISQPIYCNGDCDGSLSANVSGGTPAYIYQWLPGGITVGLCAGTYTVLVTDFNGCTATASSTLNQPSQLVPGNPITNNPTCIGCSDGSICPGAVSGGTPVYAYSISPPATFNGNCFMNLSQGIYTICVTDANGCSVCYDDTLTDPPSGIEGIFSSSEIRIYPNPFSTIATIEVSGLQFKVYAFVVRDELGREVRKSEIRNQKSEISKGNLQSGIYFYDLLDDKNNLVRRGKLLIQ